jgi:hypothetical protein
MRRREVYTLRPLTREQWAALDPANRWRARVTLADGRHLHGMYRPARDQAETDLAGLLPGTREMRERHSYMAQVTGGDIEGRGPRP